MFGTAALPFLHATMPTLSIPRAAVMMIRVIPAFCFLGVLLHIPIPSCSQVPNRVVLTKQPDLCMKHANRHVGLNSTIKSTYASVRLPNNCAWARSLPACGRRILFVRWMTLAGDRAPWRSERRSGGKIECGLGEHWESRYPQRHSGSQHARLSAVSLASKRVWTRISVLSSFTAPALALAMCLRTASVVSSTRVLGRWNLRVAVDTRRQRLYRLRRVRSANTSSDLIALIAPVKDFEDSQSSKALLSPHVPQSYIFN